MRTGVVETVTLGDLLPYGFRAWLKTSGAARAERRARSARARRLDADASAIVLGSGLGGLVDEVDDAVRHPLCATCRAFPRSGVTGHAGALSSGGSAGAPVLCSPAARITTSTAMPDAMRPALETLKALGIADADPHQRRRLAACRTCRRARHADHRPHQLSGSNPLFGEPTDGRFVGLTEAYDRELARGAAAAADAEAACALHEGVYMWFSGPSFETPAEIRMARVLGADAVGMSTVPEVILARFFGLRVAAFSVITNLARRHDGGELSHQETKEMAPHGGEKLARVLTQLARELPASARTRDADD